MQSNKNKLSAAFFTTIIFAGFITISVQAATVDSLRSLDKEHLKNGYFATSSGSFIQIKNGNINQENKLPANTIGTGALNFIDNMARRGMEFLASKDLTSEKKKESFKALLDESFDMKTIGRFSLGRYWRVSTPQERERYLSLFQKMILEVYSQRFSDYQGQKFESRSYRLDGEYDTIVTSYIIPETGPEIQVDWRVRYKNDRYRIVDVIVEGVSMSLTQRSDFASVIQRGGGKVQTLIAHLEEKNL